MKHIPLFILPVLAFVLIPAGCARIQTDVGIERAFDKDTRSFDLSIIVGEVLTMTFPSNPSTGYTWDTNEVYDKSRLQMIRNEYIEPDKAMPGQPGKQIYDFKALKSGKTQLKLVYKRSWEKKSEGQKTVIYNLTIF